MFGRSRPGARRLRRARSARSQYLLRRKPLFEVLEERRLLAVMTVTDLGDDTLANLAGDGLLSLREAVQALNTGANVDGIPPTSGAYGTDDEIVFDPTLFAGGPQTIAMADAAGEFALTTSMTITGPGAKLLTIDAGDGTDNVFNTGDGFRIFNIADGAGTVSSITIAGLTLTGGDVSDVGGAIRNQFESLAVRDSVITGNAAFGGGSSGGGIYANPSGSGGSFELTRSTVSRNASGFHSGGVFASSIGGALDISYSTISENMSASFFGGGISTSNQNDGTTTISHTTISDNNTVGRGGGIHVSNISGATTTISNSTISGNSANQRGGGAALYPTGGTITLFQSTISGNSADDDGGGVMADIAAGAAVTIAHSTITGNTSDFDTAGGGSGGGIYARGAGALALNHTIVAQNSDNSATMAEDVDVISSAPGTFTATFNLIGDGNGSGLTDGVMGNQVGTAAVPIDPLLGPLNPNGGQTQTHQLLTGSPAIDAGDPAAVAGMGGVPEFDQRGNPFIRDFDAGGAALIDIGAYERQTVIGLSLVVDTLVDENDGDYSGGDLSLREAIGLANGSVGADTITFAAGLNGGTIVLCMGELLVNDAVSINANALGSGITIDASGNDDDPATDDGGGSRIFNIDDGTGSVDIEVELVNLTLTGGDAASGGGAILTFEDLTIVDSTITGNHAELDGGGIAAYAGDLTIQNSTISNNSTAEDGGGVYANSIDNFSITNSTVSGNDAGDSTGDHGGGLYLLYVGTATISSSTISGNFAGGRGGGVYLYGNDTAAITNSTISGNRANGNGGGVYSYSGNGDTTTIAHSTITGNTSDDDDDGSGSGGGAYATGAGTFTLTHTIISGNTDNTGTAPDLDATTSPPGTFTRTFNLIGNNTGSGVAAVNGNIVNTDPLLGSLTDNGGPTRTHMLMAGSPAIEAGDPALVAGVGGVPEFDQRGNPFVRVFDGNGNGTDIIDIGAFEVTAFELVAPDDFEPNDTLLTATVLGSPIFVTVSDLSIHDTDNGPDVDYFRYTAHYTGKLSVRIYFRDDFGDLDLEVRDRFDNVIAFSGSFTDDEEIIIPVVAAEMYFIRVFGFDDDINNYVLEVENFQAPAPTGVHLDPLSDTGMMNNDNVTSDTTPTFFIQTDVLNFVDTNNNALFQDPDTFPSATEDKIDALSPAEAQRILDGVPLAQDDDGGIAVEITLINTTDGTFVIGFAEAVIGVLPEVYRFTPTAALTPGVYLVSARTKVFDGQGDANGDPDQAMGRSNASPPLWFTIDDGAEDVTVTADLIASSDTGMFNDDNVTNKWQPAFQGVAPANYKVRLYANGSLVGQTVAGSDTSDVFIGGVGGAGGAPDDGLGIWEITTEPLADGGYDIVIEVEDAAGNTFIFDPVFNPDINEDVDIVIDKIEPNTPFLDLLSDTGRHDNDNITKDNNPFVSMTSTDPNIQLAQLLFTDNLKFRIFDRFENSAEEVLIYDSAQDPLADNFQTPNDMFTRFMQLTRQLPFLTPASPAIVGGLLADGVHNLKLEVEDRAGNISHDFLLEITIDTEAPPVSFGLPTIASAIDGLKAESDTGVTTVPATFADRITSDTTPTLWGRAEADTIVRVYLDRDYDGIIDLNTDTFLGQTVAVPFDGNDAYPDGYWELTSALDLNELFVNAGLEKDGLRRLLVTAEDVAGNPMPMLGGGGDPNAPAIEENVDELHIFIDTQGPQVTEVTINNLTSEQYDLFDPKPSQTGPTPLVDSLTIHFRDLPSRVQAALAMNSFLYPALVNNNGIAAAPGNYLLVGDHNGIIPIESITVNNEVAADYTFSGTLTQVTSTSIIRDNNLFGAVQQPVVGDYILINNGAAAGQVRRIVAYNSGTGQMTLDVPLLNLPAAGDSYTITTFAEATVVLDFFTPLPDDRYTLTVSDNLVDPAGNKLDGESNADEPQEMPTFPSGDGVPGGSFVARFTIDSRPELGSYVAVDIDIDINGNFIWDPAPVSVGGDATNVDLSFTLPVRDDGTIGLGGYNVHDLLFAGKFRAQNGENGVGTPPYFDQLAAFGNSAEGIPADDTPQFRWIIDTDSDGVVDDATDIIRSQTQIVNGFNVAGAIPVAGNFDGILANGDEIGLYNAGRWALDTNKNFFIDAADTFLTTNLFGAPIVGDFDGDGDDDLAVFNSNQFFFDLADDGFGGSVDQSFIWGFPGVLDKPVAADMDQDGIDDVGLWVPRTSASLPQGVAEWYFLLSNDRNEATRITGQVNTLNHPFTPTPFGFDIFAEFGDERSLPIVGNFDPPVAASAPNQNTSPAGDYDGDGSVEWSDYQMWSTNFGTTNVSADGNGDGRVDAADYTVWRDAFGSASAAASGGGALAASTTTTADSTAATTTTTTTSAAESTTIEVAAVEAATTASQPLAVQSTVPAAVPVAAANVVELQPASVAIQQAPLVSATTALDNKVATTVSTAGQAGGGILATTVEPSLAAMLPVTTSLFTTAGVTSSGVVSVTFDVQPGDSSLLLLAADSRSAGIDAALGEDDPLDPDDAWADAWATDDGPAGDLAGASAAAWSGWDEL